MDFFVAEQEVFLVEEVGTGVFSLCLVVVELDRWDLLRFEVEVVVGRRDDEEEEAGAWGGRPHDLSVGDKDAFCM